MKITPFKKIDFCVVVPAGANLCGVVEHEGATGALIQDKRGHWFMQTSTEQIALPWWETSTEYIKTLAENT